MSDDFSKATPRPWVVERHDQDDGSISYEIWNQTAPNYHRVVTLNDADNEASRTDASLIVTAVNERGALRQALEEARGDFERMSPMMALARKAAAELAAILKGDQGAEVAAAMQEVAKRGIIKGGDDG